MGGGGASAFDLAGAFPVDVGHPDLVEDLQGEDKHLEDADIDAAVGHGLALGDPPDLNDSNY
ncbi:hypothetical protein GCM10009851_21380 [Herbiconiux moechotypicola]|uniref:Uncharacterized protein n=1 Tax=Herbiconiux moechotypicola TaxID=637393 RepID=A0ABP5QHD4_9MICO